VECALSISVDAFTMTVSTLGTVRSIDDGSMMEGEEADLLLSSVLHIWQLMSMIVMALLSPNMEYEDDISNLCDLT
jgi:positive regulator of sigma E activity